MFSQAIVLVVRGSGSGVNWANVVDISRTKLRPDPGEAQAQTGWSIRKFVKTARRYREIEIKAGQHVITAADPLPDDLRQALDAINHAS